MSNAQATLGKAATSIEEIGTARQAAKAFVAALPHIMDCRRRIDEKNRLLKSMAAAGTVAGVGQPVDMADVDNAWDSFTAQLQQHDTHLDEQKNQLQGQLTRQASTPEHPNGPPGWFQLLHMLDLSFCLADHAEQKFFGTVIIVSAPRLCTCAAAALTMTYTTQPIKLNGAAWYP